ncbi:hypothetical protein MHK_003363, partial [Candidatus Magnetomorum sp. HK-1]
ANKVEGSIRTPMPVANVDNSLTVTTSQPTKLIVFSNNPNSWVDAPQLMNTAAVASVILDGAVGSGFGKKVVNSINKGMKEIKKGTKLIEKIKNQKKKIEKFLPAIQIFLEAARQIYFINCSLTGSATDCNQVKGQWETYFNTISGIINTT